MRYAWSWIFVWLVFVLAASPALAQSTGGSFGGGSFGGGGTDEGSSTPSYGGGSSSPSTDWGSSGSSPSTTYDTSSSSSSGGGSVGLGGLCCLLMFVGGIALVVMVARKKKGGGGPMAASGPMPGGLPIYSGPKAMHVSQLSLGVDWRARRDLQAALMRLAQTGDTRSPQGLATLLRETVLALRRAELAWLYFAHKSAGPYSPQNAEATFHQMATSARSSFQHELVRGTDGQVTQQNAPNVQANANEGEGTVVVHLVVAAYRPLAAPQAADAGQIRMALDNRAALTAEQLGAIEVIWSPAAENDRLSTAELEQFYPDMRLIDPNSIAGRIFCTFCRGPFAMELITCPHCGAPAEQSKDNRAPR